MANELQKIKNNFNLAGGHVHFALSIKQNLPLLFII